MGYFSMYQTPKLNEKIFDYIQKFESVDELQIWGLPETDVIVNRFIELLDDAIKKGSKIKNERLLEEFNLEEIKLVDGNQFHTKRSLWD